MRGVPVIVTNHETAELVRERLSADSWRILESLTRTRKTRARSIPRAK